MGCFCIKICNILSATGILISVACPHFAGISIFGCFSVLTGVSICGCASVYPGCPLFVGVSIFVDGTATGAQAGEQLSIVLKLESAVHAGQ